MLTNRGKIANVQLDQEHCVLTIATVPKAHQSSMPDVHTVHLWKCYLTISDSKHIQLCTLYREYVLHVLEITIHNKHEKYCFSAMKGPS